MKYILNGKLTSKENATVSVRDLALMRGYGIFDYFRCIGLKPLFIEDHLDRFFNSAATLRIPMPFSKEEVHQQVLKLIEENQVMDSTFRLILTGGYTEESYEIGEPSLIIYNEPAIEWNMQAYEKGLKLLTLEYRRDIPEVKTINYLMGIYQKVRLAEAGAADVLFHMNGKLSELTRSNFYIVDQNNVIKTAKDDVLLGITRKHIKKMVEGKYQFEETDLYLDDLKSAKEVFISGSGKKIVPIRQVEEQVFNNGKVGEVTKDLIEMFEDYSEAFVRD
ncbi:aminotransferase class IV [Sediminitomix flava]|uniref:branched-chain-amino-acid transaminase n=1 Tax=Sediminitomix flava TaxID=379075 RepID=A0A315ZCJ5_SEDFL|nr:aminotransferase class IV [Sediminitomix flava]PWJ43022.1 D-alanine transaminase/branched-chain amino acid aminotransferase [Sediminitomix flava]